MKSEKRALLRPCDLLIALVIAAVALLPAVTRLISSPGAPSSVVVSADGAVSVYPLSEDRTVVLPSRGCELLLVIENGAVRVAESSCPNRDCVLSGPIMHTGQSIVCLPAHVVITVEGGAPDADIILG